MMWGTILGLAFIIPWMVLQLTKATVKPGKEWEISTLCFAIIGVIVITVAG